MHSSAALGTFALRGPPRHHLSNSPSAHTDPVRFKHQRPVTLRPAWHHHPSASVRTDDPTSFVKVGSHGLRPSVSGLFHSASRPPGSSVSQHVSEFLPFQGRVVFHSLKHTAYHSFTDGHVAAFHLLAAVNVGVRISPRYFHSFRYLPRSAIPGQMTILFLIF